MELVWHRIGGGAVVKLVEEYLRHAEECRKLLAQVAVHEHREKIQSICDMWARLAEERRRQIEAAAGGPISD